MQKTAKLVVPTAGGCGKPPGMATQAADPQELMQAWCCLILKHSRSESVGLKEIFVAVTRPALIPWAHTKKLPALLAAVVVYHIIVLLV